ncbi:MAG: FecR domain-containing protein [Cytophagales bacterium]|nr:FecR domain-containing protein [Cytophagales bacterium]
MDYSQYKVEDFIQDESFVQWVLVPNDENNAHWEKIKSTCPETVGKINLAIDMLHALKQDENELTEDSKKIWENLQPLLDDKDHDNFIAYESRSNKLGFWLKVAAGIILIMGISYLYFQSSQETPVVTREIHLIEKSNPRGVRSVITLNDGSKVILNSESSISYSSDFGERSREISLSGEAFFEVVKKPRIPFVVNSGNVKTTALGTSFNIKGFPNDEAITIALASGVIEVREAGHEKVTTNAYLLEPGEQIRYAKKNRDFEKSNILNKTPFLWKNGIISFHQASLQDIKLKLERWYDVTITIENNPSVVVNYDGSFDNLSLENVLKSMSFSLNFEFSFVGDNEIRIMFN